MDHVKEAKKCRRNIHLYNWLNKIWNKYNIILEANATWNTDEKRLIKEYRDAGIYLRNSTDGGDNQYCFSKETKRKISEKAKGRMPWNRLAVRCIDTEEVFECIDEAEKNTVSGMAAFLVFVKVNERRRMV